MIPGPASPLGCTDRAGPIADGYELNRCRLPAGLSPSGAPAPNLPSNCTVQYNGPTLDGGVHTCGVTGSTSCSRSQSGTDTAPGSCATCSISPTVSSGSGP